MNCSIRAVLFSGGTFKNNSNLLGRRKEQEALEKEKQTLESAIASVKGEIQTAQKQVENFVKDANAKEETVKELELKKNTAQIKYEQAVSVKEQKEKEYRAIANDGKEIENQKALIEDSLSRIDSDLELSKQKEEQAKRAGKNFYLSNWMKNVKKQVELQEKISQNRLEVSSFQQKNNYVAENIHRIEESLHDLETEYNKLMQEQKNSDDTVSEMEQAIAGYEEKKQTVTGRNCPPDQRN